MTATLSPVTPEQLRAFCATDPVRFILCDPWRHEGFIYATDGRRLIEIPDDGREALPKDREGGGRAPDVAKLFKDAFDPCPPGKWVRLRIPDGCSVEPEKLPCRHCNGTGKRKCRECRGEGTCRHCGDGSCQECDGDGEYECEECGKEHREYRYPCGSVAGGLPLNGCYVRDILSIDPATRFLVNDFTGQAVSFEGAGFRGILMPAPGSKPEFEFITEAA